MPRRVCVFGAGAVGSYLGGLLELGGHDVTLVGRPRILDPMRTAGVRVREPTGIERTARPELSTDPGAISSKFDTIILTVKAYSVAECLPALASLLSDGGFILPFQNGVGSDRLLVSTFGRERIIASTLTVSVGIDEPAVVQRYSDRGGLAWSPFDAEVDASWMHDFLASSGLSVRRVPGADSLRWSKLLLNAVGSAQCAVLQTDLASIVANLALFRIEQKAMRETVDATGVAGIRLVDLPGYSVRLVSQVCRLPDRMARQLMGRSMAQGRGGKPPTLRADVARAGPNEIRYLNGATVALGRLVGVETPVNERLTKLVEDVTGDADAKLRFTHNPDLMIESVLVLAHL
jgi:2-dehydropantoate 2-reductase